MGPIRQGFAAAREDGLPGMLGFVLVFVPTSLLVLPCLPFALTYIYLRELVRQESGAAESSQSVQPAEPVHTGACTAGVIDLAAARRFREENPH